MRVLSRMTFPHFRSHPAAYGLPVFELHYSLSTSFSRRNAIGRQPPSRATSRESGSPNRRTVVANIRRFVMLCVGCTLITMTVVASPTASYGSGRIYESLRPKKVRTFSLHSSSTCPWVRQSLHHQVSPPSLANEVLSKMTLAQKANLVVLATYPPLENRNRGVPSLCIPPLTLSDGPNGVANGLTGVTQLPAAIGIAASFNPSLARSVGEVMGTEARAKGIDVVQGPELNLARVPESGRIFEAFGEDPFLTSVLGVASIEGIQSTGALADAKHFTAYTQETARLRLNQVVSSRALAELYNAPFRAAVQQAHVASLMCSYGSLNGVNTCSDPYLYTTLKSWGFTGFVRSDLKAVRNIAKAFRAGIALVKPASASAIMRMVTTGEIPLRDLNRAVRTVLTTMFAGGLIAHPLRGSLAAIVTTPAHADVALRAAESSVVLLKNAHAILPLATNDTSIALIGTDAGQLPQVTGGGSSYVHAPFVITPLWALRTTLGPRVRMTYQPGGLATFDIDELASVDGLHGRPLKLLPSTKSTSPPGKADISVELSPNVTPAIATATKPSNSDGWTSWGFKVRARTTGDFEISMEQAGDMWMYFNGRALTSSSGLHAPSDLTAMVSMTKGRTYYFGARWFQERGHPAPRFGISYVTPQIDRAVAAARKARIAIVFAGNLNSEGVDSPNLQLTGDTNALIAAVAAANSHTIVVLNTGGAVLMPWLSKVAAVIEGWYPGEQDGRAIAAVLTGAVDPSGRLPITFPSSVTAQPAANARQFPGIGSTVNFGSIRDLGYRWYQSYGVRPLFPFGFGLDYTTFTLSRLSLTSGAKGATVEVLVRNTGKRTGADVVQAYVKYPSVTGEPPEQLRAFARVLLAPGTSKKVTLRIPESGFQIFRNNVFVTVPGTYSIDVGASSANLTIHLLLRRQ